MDDLWKENFHKSSTNFVCGRFVEGHAKCLFKVLRACSQGIWEPVGLVSETELTPLLMKPMPINIQYLLLHIYYLYFILKNA